MFIDAMSAMMERISPLTVRHVEPRPPANNRRLADQVLKQMRREFFVASPFLLHASVPELMAGAWSLTRETLMCGVVPRGQKEIVAAAVSNANRCPFCETAHTSAVRAAKASDEALADWAKATGRAGHPALATRPFEGNEAEYMGTVLCFHYLNRVVSVFLEDKMIPLPTFMDGSVGVMARIMMGGMLRRAMRNHPGSSLVLLPESDPSLAWQPSWAAANHTIAGAIAGWSATIEELAHTHLPAQLLTSVGAVIEAWPGGDVYSEPGWLTTHASSMPKDLMAAADLALMTALAPYRVRDAEVENVLNAGMSNKQMLVLVAWSAYRASRRVTDWTMAAFTAKTT